MCVTSIQELRDALIKEDNKPLGFHFIINLKDLIIVQIDSSNDPVFKCSIVIHDDLTLRIYKRNTCIQPSQYRHVITGKVS